MNTIIDTDQHIQIETTTRCTLFCPACSRTRFADNFNRPVPIRDMDPNVLWHFMDCSSGRSIKNMVLCGDWGDSIYYPNLFELLDQFRDTKTFTIVTNGSYQKSKFWNQLIVRLDDRDTIQFSIDGLEDSNHLYRKNSDWPSTMAALEIVSKSPVNLEWATNVFSFNYLQLDSIKALAESFGARWICKKTARFGDPSLRPPEQFIDKAAEFYHGLVEKNLVIEPKCRSISRNSITSDHMYVPCGWLCDPFVFYKSPVWKNKDKWSIYNTTMDDLLEHVLTPWIQEVEQSPMTLCKMKCKPGQVPIEVLNV